MKKLNYIYNNIDDFYHDAINPTKDGDINATKDHLNEQDVSFRGLSNSEIISSKYGYTKGLKELEQLNLDINLGGSGFKCIYNELDGDDINYDRLLEGLPSLHKRIRKYGIGSSKFINVYVVISENCDINASEMLIKAYTAIQIVDLLENLGCRVAIWSCDNTIDNNGRYKDECGVNYSVKVCLKKYEDSLNKSLILNGISPWFFRYFMFAHQKGRYKTSLSMGHAMPLNMKVNKENIIINKGECLTKKSADLKIEEIQELFKIY